jgi:lysophospholipase L1-like esterase
MGKIIHAKKSYKMTKKSFFLSLFVVLSLSTYAQNKIIKVACIGNSITYGALLNDRDKDSYPMVLNRLLGERYEVQNFGVSGATMTFKGNLPYIKELRFREALAYNPDIVVIKLGTNDGKAENQIYMDDFLNGAAALVDSFEALSSKPQIFLCYPAKVYNNGLAGISDSVIVNTIIPCIADVARHKNIPVIDLHSATDGMPENFSDNVHPNEAGAIAIAKAVKESINKCE